jgi:hypothetical protein
MTELEEGSVFHQKGWKADMLTQTQSSGQSKACHSDLLGKRGMPQAVERLTANETSSRDTEAHLSRVRLVRQ